MVGITAYGAYIPQQRLERMAIFQSMGWFAPAIIQFAQGEKAICKRFRESSLQCFQQTPGGEAIDVLTQSDDLAVVHITHHAGEQVQRGAVWQRAADTVFFDEPAIGGVAHTVFIVKIRRYFVYCVVERLQISQAHGRAAILNGL